jgi:hypothetical protein
MSAPAVDGISTAHDTAGVITLSRPTLTAGDLLVLLIFGDSDVTGLSVSGGAVWNLYNSHSFGAGDIQFWSYYRVASSSEPSTYTVTFTGGNPRGCAALYALIGAAVSPEAISTYGDTTSGTVSAPSLTTLSANDMVICAWGCNTSGASAPWSLPGTVTPEPPNPITFTQVQGNVHDMATAIFFPLSVGATSAQSATHASVVRASAFQIAVPPGSPSTGFGSYDLEDAYASRTVATTW